MERKKKECNSECTQFQLTCITGAVFNQGWATYYVSRALISPQRLYEQVLCCRRDSRWMHMNCMFASWLVSVLALWSWWNCEGVVDYTHTTNLQLTTSDLMATALWLHGLRGTCIRQPVSSLFPPLLGRNNKEATSLDKPLIPNKGWSLPYAPY